MQIYKTFVFLIAILLTPFFAVETSAQTFSVNLGGRDLGTMIYAQDGNKESINSTLNNTPLGVFNGSFEGTLQSVRSKSGAKVQQYYSVKASTRKNRKISVLLNKGRAIETTISPLSERTELSDASRVPAPVVSPVTALGRLISASGCGVAFSIYDGRRVISLTPTGSEKQGSSLICDVDYSVIYGPGHFSPFYINSISVRLTYDLSKARQELTILEFSSGLFKLELARQN